MDLPIHFFFPSLLNNTVGIGIDIDIDTYNLYPSRTLRLNAQTLCPLTMPQHTFDLVLAPIAHVLHPRQRPRAFPLHHAAVAPVQLPR